MPSFRHRGIRWRRPDLTVAFVSEKKKREGGRGGGEKEVKDIKHEFNVFFMKKTKWQQTHYFLTFFFFLLLHAHGSAVEHVWRVRQLRYLWRPPGRRAAAALAQRQQRAADVLDRQDMHPVGRRVWAENPPLQGPRQHRQQRVPGPR